MEHRPDVVRAEPKPRLGALKQPMDVLVADLDTLRRAGRARGIDDVGQVVGRHVCLARLYGGGIRILFRGSSSMFGRII